MKSFRQILIILISMILTKASLGQQLYTGQVFDGKGRPIPFVTVHLIPINKDVMTDSLGKFLLNFENLTHVSFSKQGYVKLRLSIDELLASPSLTLEESTIAIEEVSINTGYYKIKPEQATGSVVQIDNQLLNRNPSSNILERLEGVSSGLQFDRRQSYGDTKLSPSLRIRGLGSINSDSEPLIILDNFPYQGDLQAINPNDIESVTILKDASAAAIWGAKAGNGVIVLTSKSGKRDRTSIDYSGNMTMAESPNLFYSPNFIPAKDMMELEDKLYQKGNYYFFDFFPIPDYVSLLNKRDKGEISRSDFEREKQRMQQADIRRDAAKSLYQGEVQMRHHLAVAAKHEKHSYRSSIGWESTKESIIGNTSRRATLNFLDQFQVNPRLQVTTDLQLGFLKSSNNGYSLDLLNAGMLNLSPYASLFNADGSYASMNFEHSHDYRDAAEANGLLDWTYNPVKDRGNRQLTNHKNTLQIQTGMEYNPIKALSFSFKYRYGNQLGKNRNEYDRESYFVRNMVNAYTQPDGERIIPLGDIVEGNNSTFNSHNLRFQLNFNKSFANDHQINILAGSEFSHQNLQYNGGFRYYGYSPENQTYMASIDYATEYLLRPAGAAKVPSSNFRNESLTDRFISYYANSIYEFKDQHVLSASVRWDASNIFGVSTNQKGVPLWSIGFSENLKVLLKDAVPQLDLFKIRGSYGVSGNVNNSVSSLATMRFEQLDFVSGRPYAKLTSAGNPSLRWEKLKTLNLGLDIGMFSGRFNATFDYYQKEGLDLIGPNYLDPTTGIISVEGTYPVSNLINYANLRTKGIDLSLAVKPVQTNHFDWNVNLLWSWTGNKVTNYLANENGGASSYVSNLQPRQGYSRDALFSWEYGGLGTNGQLLTPDGDQQYGDYFNAAVFEDLKYIGLAFPPYQGSLRNTLRFKSLEISAVVEWKNGFYYKRNSIDYSRLFSTAAMHIDYLKRWKTLGDELKTNVPALPEQANPIQDALYNGSSIMFEKGDFVRLTDLTVHYAVPLNSTWIRNFRLFFQTRNVGILWRSSQENIDPESVSARYPQPRNYTLGLQLEL